MAYLIADFAPVAAAEQHFWRRIDGCLVLIVCLQACRQQGRGVTWRRLRPQPWCPCPVRPAAGCWCGRLGTAAAGCLAPGRRGSTGLACWSLTCRQLACASWQTLCSGTSSLATLHWSQVHGWWVAGAGGEAGKVSHVYEHTSAQTLQTAAFPLLLQCTGGATGGLRCHRSSAALRMPSSTKARPAPPP